MLMLAVPSATFDERLIQRSGSGETDNTSSSSGSGLATPQDEDVPPLGATLDLKSAVKTITSNMMRRTSTPSGKQDGWLSRESPSLGLNSARIMKGRMNDISVSER